MIQRRPKKSTTKFRVRENFLLLKVEILHPKSVSNVRTYVPSMRTTHKNRSDSLTIARINITAIL
jgi:hypothetical protein